MLNQKLAIEERKDRNHRIIIRGTLVESFVPEIKEMTDEEAVAHALDKTGYDWARNPSPGGFSIPLLDRGSTRNFYPDFLLWLVDDASGKQWLTFIDPKGLRNLDLSHSKLGLYKEVKTLEMTLASQALAGEAPLVLNAFILTPTKFADLLNVGDSIKKIELENSNVLFMEDGANTYLKKLFVKLK